MNLSFISAWWLLLLDDGLLVEDSSVGVGPSYDRARCRFEALLVAFLREISDPNCFLPFPPMLGDGKHVDLYKLFMAVKGLGGYDAVGNGKVWDLVGKESGLGVSVGSSVKLVYSKYLSAFEAWVKKVGNSKVSPPERCLVDNSDEVDVSDSKCGLSSEGENHDDDNSVLVLDPSGGGSESSGLKRKRESVFDLLSWVTGVATNPCDPAVGCMPEKSKWKSYSNQEVWKQVLLFREAVFHKRGFLQSSSEQHSWQSQKMHLGIYDDQLGATYNLRKRLKHDKKLLFEKLTSTLRSSSDTSVGIVGDLDRTPSSHTKDQVEKKLLDSYNAHSGLDRSVTICIPVGPNHQAEVPEWIGMTFESDSKWLWTQIWPLETTRVSSRLHIERSPIGKGRKDSCGCLVPGSIKCVRFHIAEKRDKVKVELGVTFYQWSFDKVGEDVRHLWTYEEERQFKDVVQSNPSSSKRYFWDYIFRTFPKKSRANLVSYYFNVFLLRRRRYQNRHTPYHIDSDDDDDEEELKSRPLRNIFGHHTQKTSGSILLAPKKPQTKGRYRK